MSLAILDRQERIEGINRNIKVLVIGAGGIGFWVTKFLAMSGVEELYVFDPDTLEESNLNRLDVDESMLGKNKADIIKEVVKQIRPDIKIRTFPFILRDHTYPKGVDWVVDCTDKHKCQLEHEAMAQKNGARYLKAGYDGESMSINHKVGQWDSGETQDGYRVTPSWVVPTVMVAALAVGKVLKYHGAEMGGKVKDFYRYF